MRENNSTYIKRLNHSDNCMREFPKSKILVSHLLDYNNQVNNSPLSVKIVDSGVEHYKVNNKRFAISSKSYLIVNSYDEFEVDVKTDETTKGVCVYPSQLLMNEVYNYRINSKSDLLDTQGHTNNQIEFTQKVHGLATTKTGMFLAHNLAFIQNGVVQNKAMDLTNLYIKLAEYLVDDQLAINQQLLNLNSSKKQTKEELYRRLSLARDYIHDNFTKKIIIEELATLSCLSKYHFLRSFRDFYKCTPYQYILKLKLAEAQKLRLKGFSFPQISDMTGFSDAKNLRKALSKLS